MRRSLPPWIEIDDLMGAGALGLIAAFDRFDPKRGTNLETYAKFRIRGAMLDYLRNLDSASRDLRKKSAKGEAVFRNLSARLCRSPKSEEMARALRLSLADWHRMVRDIHAIDGAWVRSMVTAAPEQEQVGFEEPATGEEYDPYELCWRREQKDILRQALDKLSERDRAIVHLYHVKLLTMKQIGEKLHIDESRVSQVHRRILTRLRKHTLKYVRNQSMW